MSPELERLLTALYDRDTCEPAHRERFEKNVARLLQDSMSRVPLVDRQKFLDALRDRYHQFLRARRKPPTLPPNA
jgi:hypothetical protein